MLALLAASCSAVPAPDDTGAQRSPPSATASTPVPSSTTQAPTTTATTTTTTIPVSTSSPPTTAVSSEDAEFDDDVQLIVSLYAGWSQAVSVSQDEIEAYLAAHLYPDLPRCAPGEKTLPAYTAERASIKRADEWTITWGPLNGVRPSGRVYEVQLAELDSPSHVAILHGVAYVFWNCKGATPTQPTYEASVIVDDWGTMQAYSAWHDPDAGGFFGSGCSPGTANLPDGVWYGLIAKASAESIAFDLYCKGPPPADAEEWAFTIVNNNERIRQVPIGSGARAFAIADDGGHVVQPYSSWYRAPHPGMFCPVDGCWDVVVFVNRGAATEIIQTWSP
ncbi:MAG: hypothetical protein ACR2N2_05460 [Acidimicrobiia bacterium]